MSRSGRANELLSDWRDHPRGCTADHGWADGYTGPCTDETQDIIEILVEIDPGFLHDQIGRLEALVWHLGGQAWLDRLAVNDHTVRAELDEMRTRRHGRQRASGVSTSPDGRR